MAPLSWTPHVSPAMHLGVTFAICFHEHGHRPCPRYSQAQSKKPVAFLESCAPSPRTHPPPSANHGKGTRSCGNSQSCQSENLDSWGGCRCAGDNSLSAPLLSIAAFHSPARADRLHTVCRGLGGRGGKNCPHANGQMGSLRVTMAPTYRREGLIWNWSGVNDHRVYHRPRPFTPPNKTLGSPTFALHVSHLATCEIRTGPNLLECGGQEDGAVPDMKPGRLPCRTTGVQCSALYVICFRGSWCLSQSSGGGGGGKCSSVGQGGMLMRLLPMAASPPLF